MKSDLQMHKDVTEELRWDPRVNEAEIGVSVKEGVVTLTGFVETLAQNHAAEGAVERVAGVCAIAEALHVRPASAVQPDDTEIAHSALTALSWNTEVPADDITAIVEGGWVTLNGECNGTTSGSRPRAPCGTSRGVKGLLNLVDVKPAVSAVEVKSKIETALKRNAELDAKRITVDTSEGTVTLKGNVRSWRRADAENAAWAVPVCKRSTTGWWSTPHSSSDFHVSSRPRYNRGRG